MPSLTLTPETTADAVEERPSLETREARRLPVLRAAKEMLEGTVEPLQRPALDGDRAFRHLRKVPAALGQGLALVEVCPALSGLPVAVDPFLQGGVVELALVLQRPLEPPPAAARLRQQAVDNLSVRGDEGHAVVPPDWAWARASKAPRNAT